MNETRNSSDSFRAVLVIVATVGMIAFNGLAAAGYVNGVTPAEISARYPTVITPAGYAFTIWGLIYVGTIAFSIYQAIPSNIVRFRSVRTLYILSCLLNCAWIYFWHREALGICLGLISALCCSLILIMWQFRNTTPTREALFTKAPFGVYAGWVTAATLVNLAVYLSAIGLNWSDNAWVIFGSACFIVAAGAAILVRFRLRHFLYPLAVAWAVTAIAVKQSANTKIVVAAAVCVIVCLVLSVSFVMDHKSSTYE